MRIERPDWRWRETGWNAGRLGGDFDDFFYDWVGVRQSLGTLDRDFQFRSRR